LYDKIIKQENYLTKKILYSFSTRKSRAFRKMRQSLTEFEKRLKNIVEIQNSHSTLSRATTTKTTTCVPQKIHQDSRTRLAESKTK
jgi:hypothetical protein